MNKPSETHEQAPVNTARNLLDQIVALQNLIPEKEDDPVDQRLIELLIKDENTVGTNKKPLLPEIEKAIRDRISSSRAWFREYITHKLSLAGTLTLDPEEKFTVQETAKELKVSVSLAYQLVEEGELSHYRVSSQEKMGKILVTRRDINEFLQARRIVAKPRAATGSKNSDKSSS